MNEDQEADSNAKKQKSEAQKEVEQPPALKRKASRLRFSAILRKNDSEVDKKRTLRSRKETKSPSVKNIKARKTQEGDNVQGLEGNKAQTPNSLQTIEVDNRLKSLLQWQA
ncbi:hypothetical protein TELCIR_10904 [Teladorsagia circumcincta]|uniref:Uncharacterized protein n=1 Tax=Teladorsagia circumcincta TaxID=45464 RepID=A0A2G9UAU2_TELCI|nr:hypothetical protein TELCIR_10904 [Teladorsagia circumcincta]